MRWCDSAVKNDVVLNLTILFQLITIITLFLPSFSCLAIIFSFSPLSSLCPSSSHSPSSFISLSSCPFSNKCNYNIVLHSYIKINISFFCSEISSFAILTNICVIIILLGWQIHIKQTHGLWDHPDQFLFTRQVGPTKPSLQWHLNLEQAPSPHSSFVVHRCPPIAKGCKGTVSVADINFSRRPYGVQYYWNISLILNIISQLYQLFHFINQGKKKALLGEQRSGTEKARIGRLKSSKKSNNLRIFYKNIL